MGWDCLGEAEADSELVAVEVLGGSLDKVLVVADIDVGLELANAVTWAWLIAEQDLVHAAEGGHLEHAVHFVVYALTALGYVLVSEDTHHEVVSEAPGLHEVGDVAGVEEVKNSVGEDNSHIRGFRI